MKLRSVVLVLLASLILAPLALADTHTKSADFDTIDNAPEEKERGSLSKADSKKALEGFSESISTIQSSLERCESDVCRQVSVHADKRAGLVMQAQQDIDNAASYILEVRGVVRKDIGSLEKCETDVCREVLAQEQELLTSINDFLDADSDGDGISDEVESSSGDLDGDGYGDVALRGEEVSLCCFDYSSVRIIHDSDTQVRTSALYRPENALLITGGGGGAGKATFNDMKVAVCPEDNCPVGAVDVNIENQPPVAIVFEPGFATEDNTLEIDKKDIRLVINDAICSQERNEIICTDAEDNQLVVGFADDTEVSCAEGDEGQVYCWGKNERGEETQVDVRGELILGEDRDPPGLAQHCSDNKCITDLVARCGDDVCVVATVEAAVNGEIILGEDRDMVMPGVAQHCRDDKCFVELAERCGDDVCVAGVAQHCKDDKCIAELAQVCGDESCVNALADLSEEVTSVCTVVRESCPSEARADGKCIVKSDVCTSDNQQDCVHLADRCPDDARADGSCVAASTVCGTSQGRVAGSPCPPDEALCMDGTCEPLTWPRCESDLEIAPAQISGDDCDDTDCDVRPSATKKGYDHYRAQSDMKAGINPNEIGEDGREGSSLQSDKTYDREALGDYLRNKSELRGADFGLAVAYAASGNEQVRNVRYNNETDEVEVEHEEEVRLFGFIPMRANARSSVRADGEVRTQLPWWSFVATKSSNSTEWMRPQQVQASISKRSARTGRNPQTTGEEVDILGMGEEKVASDSPNTEESTGRNPQTGKEIQVAAKRIDKASPKLAQASAHIRSDDVVRPVALAVQTRSVPLVEGDEIICGDLADGSPVCRVSSGDDNSVYCWGSNARVMSQESCPASRGEDIEVAVEKIERGHPPATGSFTPLGVLPVNESSVLFVVHTGDVPSSQEVEMNKAELIEAMASHAGIAPQSGLVHISSSADYKSVDDSASLSKNGLFVNLADLSLESNALVFVSVSTMDSEWNFASASQEDVKFKAGAELSKAVN